MPYPGLRPDLIISSQKMTDRNILVIKDPVTGKFFQLKEMEYFIANLFDGKTRNKSIADSQRGAILKPGRLMIGGAIVIAMIYVLVFVKAYIQIFVLDLFISCIIFIYRIINAL